MTTKRCLRDEAEVVAVLATGSMLTRDLAWIVHQSRWEGAGGARRGGGPCRGTVGGEVAWAQNMNIVRRFVPQHTITLADFDGVVLISIVKDQGIQYAGAVVLDFGPESASVRIRPWMGVPKPESGSPDL